MLGAVFHLHLLTSYLSSFTFYEEDRLPELPCAGGGLMLQMPAWNINAMLFQADVFRILLPLLHFDSLTRTVSFIAEFIFYTFGDRWATKRGVLGRRARF